MAQRDYVKKKVKPKNKSRIFPNLMMFIAVLLVILFIAILYVVSTNKKTDTTTATNQTPTEKPKASLPTKPEERWSYLKELENPDNNQITLPPTNTTTEQDKERQRILDSFTNDTRTAGTNQAQQNNANQVINQNNLNNTKPSQTPWLLQCGAFKDEANAEVLKAKLAILGISSFTKSEKFHRVLTGPYNSKQEAEKMIISLKNSGISSCITTLK